MQEKNSFFYSHVFEKVSHCVNITLMLWTATAELVMKCNASIREHSKLPAQHSCSSAFIKDLVIRKCITLFKALNETAIADVISIPLLKQILFHMH